MNVGLICFDGITARIKLLNELPNLESTCFKILNAFNFEYYVKDLDWTLCLLRDERDALTAKYICRLHQNVTVVASGEILRSYDFNNSVLLNTTDENYYSEFLGELPHILYRIIMSEEVANSYDDILVW